MLFFVKILRVFYLLRVQYVKMNARAREKRAREKIKSEGKGRRGLY